VILTSDRFIPILKTDELALGQLQKNNFEQLQIKYQNNFI
jgi:hypothetical protein